SVMPVEGDRLFEVRRTFAKPFQSPLVPEEPAFPIKLVGQGILGIPFDKQSLFVTAQPECQRLGHLLRDPVLHREYVRRLLVELTGPNGPPVIHRDQPRPYPYPVPVSLNVPLQYRVDPQLAASGYRISLEPRKLAHRISRSYDDSIDAAEIRNQ